MTRRTILSIAPGALGAVTASRASTATYFDSNGVLQTAAANVVRDAHYEQGVRTILLEGSRTNSWTHSDGSQWAGERETVTPGVLTAPDGTLTATQVLETVDNSTHDAFRQAPATPSDNATQAVSIFAKPIGRRYMWFRLRPKSGSAGDLFAGFDTQAGIWIHIDAGLTAFASAPLSQGFRRYLFTYNVGTGANQTPLIMTANDSTQTWPAYVGDVTKGFAVWGDQWELDKPFCSGFIPTAAAPVTRSPDLSAWTIPDKPHAMDVLVEFFEHGSGSDTTQFPGIAYLGNDAQTGARLFISTTGPGTAYAGVYNNGTASSQSNIPAANRPATGDRVKLRLRLVVNTHSDGTQWATAQVFQSINGGAEIAGNVGDEVALVDSWGGQTFRLNSRGTIAQGNAAYISATLTDLHVPQPSVSFTDGTGPVTIPCVLTAFDQWVPLVNAVGDREVALGTGAIFEYRYRTDYGASFRISQLKPAQLGDVARLKLQLLSGGQVTVFTDDQGYRSYTVTLWPGAEVPDPELTDRAGPIYAQSLTVKNTQAAPMLAVYGPET